MLTNQNKLHALLKLKNPSAKERDDILKIIRTGKHDLPDCVFEQAFTLLKHGQHSENSKSAEMQSSTTPATSSSPD